VDGEEGVLEVAGVFLAGGWVKLDGDAGAFRETADGFDEGEIFEFLDEGEDVAALVAAEAMKDLAVGIDVETGGLFLVEGAERHEVRAGAFQGDEGADDIDDVIGGADLFECGRSDQRAAA
jgi:hypothetical protein